MKTFITTNAIIAFMALLPSAASKEDSPPHRVFRTTRSKAAKAQGTSADYSSPPSHGSDIEPFTESKSGKSTGAKTFKEFFPNQELQAKASHAKCLKEDDDLFDELDLTLDYSSLSMSTSMSYIGKSGKSAKSSAKCSKYDFDVDESLNYSFGCVGDFDEPGSSFPLCPGLGAGMYCDGQGDCESQWCSCDEARAFCETKLNPCNGYQLEYGDDNYYYYDEEMVKDIIEFVMTMLGECAGVSLDFDSCLVKSVIDVLASSSVGDPIRKLRGAGERRMQSINATYDDDDWNDDWFQCEIPTVSDIEPVVEEASGMCDVYVTDDEYKTVLRSLVTMFTNEACVCGELY